MAPSRRVLSFAEIMWPPTTCRPHAGSTHLVGVEDVVLCLYRHMASVPAIRGAGIGRELVGFVLEQRIPPSTAVRKSLAVLLHHESLCEYIRHIHHERGLRALLRLPLELHDLGAIRESLAVAWNASFVSVYHDGVGDDPLEPLIRRAEETTAQSSYPWKS